MEPRLAGDAESRCISHRKTYSNRGNAYRQLGNFGKALSDFDRSIELNPNNEAAYWNRGVLYGQNLRDYRKGEADIKQAARMGLKTAQDLLRQYGINW